MLDLNRFYNSYTFMVKSPAAPLFIIIAEDENGNPIHIQAFAGKAGSELAANVSTLAVLATDILNTDGGFTRLLEQLSNTTSDKSILNNNGVICQSAPDALYIALNRYRNVKYDSMQNKLGRKYHPPKMQRIA